MDRARVQRMAQCALLGALALVLSYLETMIPIPLGIPGIKLGLANAAVLVALLLLDARSAATVALVKVLASGFLFGTPTMLAYSASGTVLALLVMLLMRLIPGMGAVPMSMASAIFHNVGQLLAASAMLGSSAVFFTLPVLAAAACVTGAIIGIAAQGVVNALQTGEHVERKSVDLGSLKLHAGEHVAFIGANGSGKTTAALQLAGLLETGGAVDYKGKDDGIRPRLVMQDPDSQLVKQQVEDDVAFGPENLGMPLKEMRRVVAQTMEQMGVRALAARDVNELSGGQGQQAAIAGVLAMNPQAVVFDEATSMLDTAARECFASLVQQLTAAGVAVVTVTQLPEEALAADRAVLFCDGTIAFQGTPQEALRLMEANVPGLAAARVAAGNEQSDAYAAADDRFLRCEDVTFSYPGTDTRVLHGANLQVHPGQVVGLAGPCGSGKSTLGRLLAGYEAFDGGRLLVDGAVFDGSRETREQFRRKIAYVEQRPERALFAETAFDDVLFGALNLGLPQEKAEARTAVALQAVGMDPATAREKNPFCYSGGEQRRIALAGMLVLDTPYLVLDEPNAGLDPAETQRLAALIRALCARGKGIVLIAHDRAFIDACCDDVVELRPAAPDAASTVAPSAACPASFGRYRAGSSLMHRLDPRVKIVLCLLFMIAGFLAQGCTGLGLVAIFGACMLLTARTTPAQAWACFKPFVPLALFVGAFDALFTGGGDVWWQVGPAQLTSDGVLFAAQSVVRFALVAVATSILMATTSSTQLSDGCAALAKPLKALGLRVDDATLSLSMTLRFLPLVQGEFFCVKRAQEARLAHFNSAKLLQRAAAYGPVLVPLFAGCLRRSQDLALAIESRGYGECANRGQYRAYSLALADIAALTLAVALLVAVIALRFL